MPGPPFEYDSITDALLRLENASEFGARFIPRSGKPSFYPYKDVLKRAKSVAGTLQQEGLNPGECVGIIIPTSINFLDAFLGVQLAGGIPAAIYPPVRLGRLNEYYDSTRKMLRKINARILITDNRVKKILGPVVDGLESVNRIHTAENLHRDNPWAPVSINPEIPAFLQFSSGSTREPKAVVISHSNLIANLEMMGSIFFKYYSREMLQVVCWLPLYHDMGLVGCMLNGLYHHTTVNYIEPEHFITRPAIWLQTISRFRSGASPAPQFAYGLCEKRIRDDEMRGVDLSSWLIAFNGAEPLDLESMERFSRRFSRWGFRDSTMTPVYGLAEATLAATFSDIQSPPAVVEFDPVRLREEDRAEEGKGLKLVSMGRPMEGLELRICDEKDDPLADGRVGTIMLKGSSITRGYYNDTSTTYETIRNGWLDTGDIGFIYKDELFIVGRSKDIIIIRGRNIAPQDIEATLDRIPGVRTGCTVAVSSNIEGKGEQLIVLVEKDQNNPRPEEELRKKIKEHLVAQISVAPYHIQLLEPGVLPRTSSGKKRRSDALKLFLSGDLAPPEKMGPMKLLHKIGKSQLAWGRFYLKLLKSK